MLPTFSGGGDFDRPAQECDLNVILKGRGGATSSDWSSLPSGQSKVAAEPGEEARKPGRESGRSDSVSILGLYLGHISRPIRLRCTSDGFFGKIGG